jgi:spermidine/putrescine transport system substrate-binding protein
LDLIARKKPVSSSRPVRTTGGALSRRAVLRGVAAGGAVLASGPWLVRNARSSSGELSILHWADQLKDPIPKNFTAKTGIKLKATAFSTDQEQIDKLEAGKGEGFDLCQPALDRGPQWHDGGLLAPFDAGKLPNAKNLIPSLLAAANERWQWGGLYHLPHCWGGEAIAWRTDRTTLDYGTLSYGKLWEEQYKGAVQGRPHSLLLGIGLWMDATGQLPSRRMLDAFKDEDSFKRVYDEVVRFAVDRRPWIKQFWDTSNSIRAGFIDNGCTIGQTLDGPVYDLRSAGKPVSFMAPREGAIAWTAGWTLTAAAKNVEQAYEFLNFLMTPETSALIAQTSGYNPVVAGAAALLPDPAKTSFAEAYPGDALDKLWFRRAEPSWLKGLRVQYAERLRAA